MIITREEIQNKLLEIFEVNFEIKNPGLDDNLREEHGFDSIDAIELLTEIEKMMGLILSHEQKKQAMNIRTINQICDYIESLEKVI